MYYFLARRWETVRSGCLSPAVSVQQSTPPPPPTPTATVVLSPSSAPSSRPKCGAWKKVPTRGVKTVLPDKAALKAVCVGKGKVSASGWLSCAKVVKPPHRRYPCVDCGFDCDSVKNRDQHRGSKRCKDIIFQRDLFVIATPPVVEGGSPYFKRRAQPINPAILQALRSTPEVTEVVEQVVRNPSQVETTIGSVDSDDEVVNQQQVPIVPTVVPRAVAS